MTILTQLVARLLVAPTFVVAAAILVKGYADVGDGFAAGVVAGLGVVILLFAFGVRETHRILPVRRAVAVAVAGLLLALVVGFAPLLAGDAPFTHRPGPGETVVHLGTLELLTAVAFDVGVFCLVVGIVVGSIDYAARARRGLVILLFSLVVAVLFGTGAYLMLKADLFRVVVGMTMISNAAILALIGSGLSRGAAPIHPLPDDRVSDPLVQAMALTAIVIGFGVTALLLAIAYRVYTSHESVDLDELSREEVRRERELEREEISL